MYQRNIEDNEAGQRLDKFLHKFMPLAPASFFFKMLRKKNITLNGKKAQGKEKLVQGDVLSFFLAEETIEGFQTESIDITEYMKAFEKFSDIQIIYENEHIVIMNKPANVLSQKAKEGDISINEWLIGYLLSKGLKEESLKTYKPSICNRLDRNTQGLILGAKSLLGSQELNRLISQREIKKFYRLFVKGKLTKEETLEGYLIKDEKNNKVRLVTSTSDETAYIKTRYYPIQNFCDRTLVEVELITGKSHQIRVHMSGIGHPILGDFKYGDRSWNQEYKEKYQIESQLLYACKLVFPHMPPALSDLSEQIYEAPLPKDFQKLMQIN